MVPLNIRRILAALPRHLGVIIIPITLPRTHPKFFLNLFAYHRF